ncbi:TPA: hypothetical protein ACN976_001284 [Vibrio campbellii]
MIKWTLNQFRKLRMYLRADDPDAEENKSDFSRLSKASTKSKSTKSKNRGAEKAGLFAAVGAFLMLNSSPAHAGIDGILNKLVGKFAEMFEPLISAVMGAFSSVINLFNDQATGGMTAAFTKGFDTQLALTKEVANDRISAATEPPPQMCESDQNAIGIVDSANVSRELAGNLVANMADDYLQMKALPGKGIFKLNGNELIKKYSNDFGFTKLLETPLVSGKNIETANERITAKDKIDMAVYSAMDTVDLPSSTETVSNQKRYLRQVSKVNTIATARMVLTENMADRVVTPGASESHMSLLEKEIDRTFGNETYRADLASYADSVPLAAEMNKNLAMSNKLSIMTLKKLDQLTQLEALKLIDQVGANNANG